MEDNSEYNCTVINAEKYTFWYKGDMFHRLSGPACEFANGAKLYFQNGMLHRLDGPAVIYANANRYWFIDNRKYSEADFLKEIANKGK
jgi:hypothetical protein